MTQLRSLAELKVALESLESAVQQPRSEPHSMEQVLYNLPFVLRHFSRLLEILLNVQGKNPAITLDIFVQAHEQGLLAGDLAFWELCAEALDHLPQGNLSTQIQQTTADEVRSHSYLLWESFELITTACRRQAQIHPTLKYMAPALPFAYATQPV